MDNERLVAQLRADVAGSASPAEAIGRLKSAMASLSEFECVVILSQALPSIPLHVHREVAAFSGFGAGESLNAERVNEVLGEWLPR